MRSTPMYNIYTFWLVRCTCTCSVKFDCDYDLQGYLDKRSQRHPAGMRSRSFAPRAMRDYENILRVGTFNLVICFFFNLCLLVFFWQLY